jgi:hypothetical protein
MFMDEINQIDRTRALDSAFAKWSRAKKVSTATRMQEISETNPLYGQRKPNPSGGKYGVWWENNPAYVNKHRKKNHD